MNLTTFSYIGTYNAKKVETVAKLTQLLVIIATFCQSDIWKLFLQS